MIRGWRSLQAGKAHVSSAGSGPRARFRRRPPRRSAPATPRDAGGARGRTRTGCRGRRRGDGHAARGRGSQGGRPGCAEATRTFPRARGPARHGDPARRLGALSPRPVRARAALGARPPPRPRLGLRRRLGGPSGGRLCIGRGASRRAPAIGGRPRCSPARRAIGWQGRGLPGLGGADKASGGGGGGERGARQVSSAGLGAGGPGAAGAAAAAGPGGVANGRGLASAPRPSCGGGARARRRRTLSGPRSGRGPSAAPGAPRPLGARPAARRPPPPAPRAPGSPLRPGAARPALQAGADVGRAGPGARRRAGSSGPAPFPRPARGAPGRERSACVLVRFFGPFRVPSSLETRGDGEVLENLIFSMYLLC